MPRFTLHELRQVLHEKNELKQRVLQLEEEMEYLKERLPKYVYEPILPDHVDCSGLLHLDG